MNIKYSIAASAVALIVGVGCSSAGGTETQNGSAEKQSLTVDNLEPAACEAYAAKQSRLNPSGAAWTFRMDGTTCVVTQG